MTDPYAAFSDPVGPTPRQPAAQTQPRRQQRRPVAQFTGELPTDVNAVFPALVAQESGGRAGVLGPQTRYGQAIGRTQMLPATAREMAQRVGVPFDESMLRGTTPEAAAYQDRLGLEYLKQGFEQTGNMRDALRYYHGGPDRRIWGPKTEAYSEEVLSRLGGSQALPSVNLTAAAMPADGAADYDAFSDPVDAPAAPPKTADPASGAIEAQEVTPDLLAREARMKDPEYAAAYARAQGGSEAVPERLRAVLQGQSLGFGDEILGGAEYVLQGLENAGRRVSGQEIERSASMASQAARDSERDAQAAYARENPIENFALQAIGGIATPGLGAAGNYINAARAPVTAARAAGASADDIARLTRLTRPAVLGRAAAVGTSVGAATGFGSGTGDIIERAPGTALGAVVGAGTGAIGQAATDALDPAARAVANSAARRLSRAGVNLTPGQMAAEIPVVGDSLRYVEDIAGGFNPLMTGVRRRQNEDVIRAAGNEALDLASQALPENTRRLPRNARTGYQVSQNVMRVLGDGYENILPRVRAQADGDLFDELNGVVTEAGQVLDDSRFGRFQRILDQNILSRFTEGGELSGADFKRIETTLRQQSERANRPTSTLEDTDLAEALDNTREVMRNLIARQYPEEAANIRAINSGYAVAARIRRAVTGSAGFSRQGTPTPGELTQTVANMSSEGQIMNETALLQQLASDARTALPATVGDTGSGQRAVLGGAVGLAATGGVAAFNPGLAGLIATGAVVYSRPGIAALNLVYRATDSQTASEGVELLARLAQRDPALQPYYQAAVEAALPRERTQSPTTQPAPQSAPVPTPVQ